MCIHCISSRFDHYENQLNKLKIKLNEIVETKITSVDEKININIRITKFLNALDIENAIFEYACDKFDKLKNDNLIMRNTIEQFKDKVDKIDLDNEYKHVLGLYIKYKDIYSIPLDEIDKYIDTDNDIFPNRCLTYKSILINKISSPISYNGIPLYICYSDNLLKFYLWDSANNLCISYICDEIFNFGYIQFSDYVDSINKNQIFNFKYSKTEDNQIKLQYI